MSSVSEATLSCVYEPPPGLAAQRLYAQLHEGDAVLLLGHAVILGNAQHPQLPKWLARGAILYALDADLQAYAVTDLHPDVTPVTFGEWVALTERYRTQTLWR